MNKATFIEVATKFVEAKKAEGFSVDWNQSTNAQFFAKVISKNPAKVDDIDWLTALLNRAGNASANRQVLEGAGVIAKQASTGEKATALVESLNI